MRLRHLLKREVTELTRDLGQNHPYDLVFATKSGEDRDHG